MIQGAFFKVDKDSVQEEGQVIFRYLPVYRTEIDESKTHHYYPVYAVLKSHAIDFYYHGPDVGNDENEDSKENIDHHHVHVRILHLPLSINLAVKDNLTVRLSEAFISGFSLGEHYEFSIDRTSYFYSTLPCFGGEKGELEKETKKGQKVLLRKLILDFIYDLEHSRVFDASPHIDEIEVHLRENFFFSAIAAKAAYYLNRQNYLEKWRNEDERNLYAHNLIEAEVTWLNILRDKCATESFWHQAWFNLVESEYHDVMFSNFKRYKWRQQIGKSDQGKDKDKQNIRILRETTRWFLRRYDLWHGFLAVLQSKEHRRLWLIPLILFSFIIFPTLLAKNNDHYEMIAVGVYILVGFITYLVIFLGFIYRKMFLPILGALLPRLIMATASAWIVFTTSEEFWKTTFDIPIEEASWLFLLLIPVIFFMAIELRNHAPDIKSIVLSKRIGYVLGIGCLFSLLIGIFFMNIMGEKMLTRSGYLTEYYKEHLNSNQISIEVKSIGIGIMDDDDDVFSRFKYDSITQSQIQASINALKDSLTKYNIYKNNLDSFVLADMVKLAYLNQMNPINSVSDTSWIYPYVKATYSLAYDSLESYIYFASNNSKICIKHKIPIFFWMEKKYQNIDVFPGMLLFCSLFALFMGIFVQLIFEDKLITEPL